MDEKNAWTACVARSVFEELVEQAAQFLELALAELP
jgi:hypothetical protein